MNAHVQIKAANQRTDTFVATLAATVRGVVEADEANDDSRHATLCGRYDQMSAESSWRPCHDAPMAMAKLCLVESRLGSLLADYEGNEIVEATNMVARQVGSIIRWLEAEFGIRRDDYALDYFHGDRAERRSWGLPVDGGGEIPE